MSSISNRKKEHLEAAVQTTSQTGVGAGWEDVHLVPASLPDISMSQVDVSTDIAGHDIEAPIVIASMTGGHEMSMPINQRLAMAAESLGLAIGSGSQRAALRDKSLARTYSIIRETAPGAVVLANIGVCQLVPQGDEPALVRGEIEEVVGMVDAQFLIIHLNVVEELIQPEGDSNMAGLLSAIGSVVSWSPVPVMVKETGAGMSRETAAALAGQGVTALDVGGAGGTSFARIEGARAKQRGDRRGSRFGSTFGDWGIPTAISILEARGAGLPVVATGGVRTGLDAAKALALGATAVGLGRPVLTAAIEGYDKLLEELSDFIDELKVAMVLTAARDVPALRGHHPVLTGHVSQWADQRGLL
ncbi:MAG: type 2 isopentenyl-diphosphate Delta-isomerase [Acidimicrobiia bacterium]